MVPSAFAVATPLAGCVSEAIVSGGAPPSESFARTAIGTAVFSCVVAASSCAVGRWRVLHERLPASVYDGVMLVLSAAVEPVTLTLPLPAKVRGLMLPRVCPATGEPTLLF